MVIGSKRNMQMASAEVRGKNICVDGVRRLRLRTEVITSKEWCNVQLCLSECRGNTL